MEKERNGGEDEEANGTTYKQMLRVHSIPRVHVHSCFTIKKVNSSLGLSLSPFWRRVLVRDW